MERKVIPGQRYKHFKGTYHKIIAVAYHSETMEKMVVYTHEETNETWIRPYALFIEEVDIQKYPQSKQKYRFELVDVID